MAIVNHETKEVTFKIVYCGTPLGGKTTNLAYIHSKVGEDHRGDLISLATSSDRTLFFDFLPINTTIINGFRTRFQLYTVPGQVYYNATRQLVLRGVDGLVFVADSQPSRMEENAGSFRSMCQNVMDNGSDPSRIPLVLQYNKRDLPEAAPIAYLDYLLNGGGHHAAFGSVASSGQNVFATLNSVTQQVLTRFHQVTGTPAPAGGHAAVAGGDNGGPAASTTEPAGTPPSGEPGRISRPDPATLPS
ncbi:ADP-ribosylation factor-like protein [soil metagenome]